MQNTVSDKSSSHRTAHIHRMSGPVITVTYHISHTVAEVCELIRQKLPEFSMLQNFSDYEWSPQHVKLIKLVKEDGDAYTGPFLLEDRLSDHVEDEDTIYMIYDLP